MADILTPAEMAVQQAAIDRQRKIAELLQSDSLSAPQGQMVSGHYVASSPLEYVAKLAKGLLGSSMQGDLDKRQAQIAIQQGDMLRAMFGMGGTQATTPSIMPQVSQGLAEGAKAGSIGPTNDNLARVAQVLQNNPPQASAPAQNAPLLIPGMNPATAFQIYTQDPKDYYSAFMKQYEPTEMMRNNAWMKISPEESATSTRAKMKKEGILEGTPGSTLFDFATGQRTAVPDFKTGLDNQFDANGRPVVSQIQGFSAANAAIKGEETAAQEAAKAGLDLVTVNTKNGPVMMPRSAAVQMSGGSMPTPSAQPTQPAQSQAVPQTGGQVSFQNGVLTPQLMAWMKANDPESYQAALAKQNAAQPSGTPGIPLQSEAERTAQVEAAKKGVERQFDQPQAQFALTSAVGTIDNALKQVEYLQKSPGLSNITGTIAGRTPNVSDKAINAQADLDTLKGQIGVHVLNAMREASKTGGAVGNVTEKEWPILQNQLGSLQQVQTTEQFRRGLQDVQATLSRVKAAYQREFDAKYGKQAQPQSNIDELLKKYGV